MTVLVAFLEAEPGAERELERTLSDLVEETRREPGALAYVVQRSRERATRFLVYERYADQAALDRHMAAPYLSTALRSFERILAGPPSVEAFEELGAFHRP
jgi:quinol monooxygenase YgiN